MPAKADKMERGSVTLGGIRSPVLRAGQSQNREAVVFLHGNPGSSEDWKDFIENIGSFTRALAIDMLGFGQADKPTDFDYTVDGYANHFGKFIDSEGIDRVHLVLHDFGGPWGLSWASNHADRVASVTLINIGINLGYRWHYMARIWQTPILGEVFMATTNRPTLKLALRHGNPRGLPDAYFKEMYANFDKGTRNAVLKLYRNSVDFNRIADRFANALTSHNLPALVIWGKVDPYVPVRYAEMQRKFFDVERIVLLEDSGHWPMIDNPQAVHEALMPFLRSRISDSNSA